MCQLVFCSRSSIFLRGVVAFLNIPMPFDFSNVFEDKIKLCTIMMMWVFFIFIIFFTFTERGHSFFTFGPSAHSVILGVRLNTWARWCMMACLTFFDTIMMEIVHDCLNPWIMTVIIDHKTKYLPYRKNTLIVISMVCGFFKTTSQTLLMFIMLSQVDFLLIRCLADLVVTYWSTDFFLKDKEFNKEVFYVNGL